MATRREKEKVEGGWIVRDSGSGRLVAVETEAGSEKVRPKSEAAIAVASDRHKDALKRLADR
ncbi:MAG: hypothetical protein ACE368_23015 [Paracoccaceae bacterium]